MRLSSGGADGAMLTRQRAMSGCPAARYARPLTRLERHLPLLCLVAVVLVYLPAARGEFVWDDHTQVERNPVLTDPVGLWSADIRGGELPEDTPIYRPLVMSSHAVVQAVWPGPVSEHLVNIALLAAAVALVARLGMSAGASRVGAWLAALLFGLHPGVSETVAWITGRHELLPATLTLAAWALLGTRPVVAGLLLALTPFAKESWLCIPLATAAMWPLARRNALVAASIAAVGTVVCLLVRAGVGEAVPMGAATGTPIAAFGGVLIRFVSLLLVPASADALPALHPSAAAGVGGFVLALLLLVASLRVPALALVTATGLLLAPAAVASWKFGIVADRYFLLPMAGLAAAGAVALGRARHRWPALLVAAALAALTTLRIPDWRTDLALFQASYDVDPADPERAFHLGAALQEAHRCDEALPLLRASDVATMRVRVRLQICLVETGAYAEAVALAPGLEGATAARTSARAFLLAGDPAAAESWARRATVIKPRGANNWVLLGNVLGQQGRLPEAGEAFAAALALDPDDADARHGLDAVRRRMGP
jgi:hypothetical protein